MRRLTLSVVCVLLLTCAVSAQMRVQLTGSGAPTGYCNNARYLNADNGDIYICDDATHTWGSPSQAIRSAINITTDSTRRFVTDAEKAAWNNSVPSGMIMFVIAGVCPSGFSEVTALNGKTLIGTLTANGDVGTSGGSDNITPTGTNSAPTFTGTPITAVINHTHSVNVNDPGHTHVERIINSGTAGTVGVQGASGASNANASNSPTASGTTGITATTANPAGGVSSITPAGTVAAPMFTGTLFDNRSSFLRVIFCSKN